MFPPEYQHLQGKIGDSSAPRPRPSVGKLGLNHESCGPLDPTPRLGSAALPVDVGWTSSAEPARIGSVALLPQAALHGWVPPCKKPSPQTVMLPIE